MPTASARSDAMTGEQFPDGAYGRLSESINQGIDRSADSPLFPTGSIVAQGLQFHRLLRDPPTGEDMFIPVRCTDEHPRRTFLPAGPCNSFRFPRNEPEVACTEALEDRHLL